MSSARPESGSSREARGGPQPVKRRTALRLLLAWVALSSAFPGAWAAFATDAFYRSFPLGSPGWVSPLGPASPHLTADVGAFYLGFACMFAWAAWRPSRELVLPLIGGWTIFSGLHLGWHSANTAPFTTSDAVAQLVALAGVLALPLLAIKLLPRAPARGAA